MPEDNECIASSITAVLHKYPKGNEELALKSVEAGKLKDIVISEAKSDTPVQLNLKMPTFTLNGIETATISNLRGFSRDPKKTKLELDISVPEVTVWGDYIATGKILVLPMNGHGKAVLKLKNLKIAVKVKTSVKVKDGKNYIHFDKLKSKSKVDK